jgi:hypothetical protein
MNTSWPSASKCRFTFAELRAILDFGVTFLPAPLESLVVVVVVVLVVVVVGGGWW